MFIIFWSDLHCRNWPRKKRWEINGKVELYLYSFVASLSPCNILHPFFATRDEAHTFFWRCWVRFPQVGEEVQQQLLLEAWFIFPVMKAASFLSFFNRLASTQHFNMIKKKSGHISQGLLESASDFKMLWLGAKFTATGTPYALGMLG